MDRQEKNERQRAYRAANGNSATRKYEKTVRGFLMRSYRNVVSRMTGVQSSKFHLYAGKELSISKSDFYDMAMNSDEFKQLWAAWVKSGYDMRMTPSFDRIDSSLGYVPGNVRWITHSENSRLGGLVKKKVIV